MGKKLSEKSFDLIKDIVARVYDAGEQGVWIEELSRVLKTSQSTIRYWVEKKQDLMQGIKLVPLGKVGLDRKGQATAGKPHMVMLVAKKFLKD